METGNQPTQTRELAYHSAHDLIFGQALHPVTCGDNVIIGGGTGPAGGEVHAARDLD